MMLAICLLLLGCAADLLQGQPYQVTSKELPGCNSKLGIRGNSLRVSRGNQNAPCIGYLTWEFAEDDIRRICHADPGDFQQAWAKRACFTLGLDLDRKDGEINGNRLYRCDVYAEDHADNTIYFPKEKTARLGELQTHLGKRCDYDGFQSSFDCFDGCYFLQAEPTTSPGAKRCEDVFWALTCADVNECETGALTDCSNAYDDSCTVKKACGGNSTCQNMIGSYECACNSGYKFATGDETDPYHEDRGCTDIDECQEFDNICGEIGECLNLPGTYTCSCPHPDLKNSVTGKCEGELCGCPPIDLNSKTNCQSNIGLPNEEFIYMCRDGYATSTDGKQYSATCLNGDWQMFGSCIDVNECLASPCNENTVCLNLPGTYVCQCAQGYSGDGVTCTPTVAGSDPCATFLGLGLCSNGVCTVVDGKPKCTCDGNFEGSSCDIPKYGTAFILGVTALVLLGLQLAVLFFFCFNQAARTPQVPLPPPPKGPFDPIYGSSRLPLPLPPMRRRPFF